MNLFAMLAFEQAIKEQYMGLTAYMYDVDAPVSLVDKYYVGQIIAEPMRVPLIFDMYAQELPIRYIILSNQEHEIGGLQVADLYSHFKVLKINRQGDKAQVVLLHLVYDERWRMFSDPKLSESEEAVISTYSQLIDFNLPFPAKEIDLDQVKRPPLGMDENNEMCELKTPIGHLQFIGYESVLNFRAVNRHFFYVRSELLSDAVRSIYRVFADYDGVVGYGAITKERGLVLALMCGAKIESQTIIFGTHFEGAIITISAEVMKGQYVTKLDFLEKDGTFADRIEQIREELDTGSEEIEKLRTYSGIDKYRHPFYPDHVWAVLDKSGIKPEQVWVSLVDEKEDVLRGTLLNEPQGDFGLHEGDMVEMFWVDCGEQDYLSILNVK